MIRLQKRSWRAVLALSMLALWLSGGAAPTVFAADDLVSVPDVAGKPVADAKTALATEGLLVATFDVAGSPAGSVAKQSPAPGMQLPRGALVLLEVNVAGEMAAAPKATGLSLADASTAFGALYTLKFQPKAGAAADKGKVVEQLPAMGAPLALHGVLTLTFVPDESLPAKVPVPDAGGLAPAEAVQALAAAGLHARVAKATIPGTPADLVVAQSPLPGTETNRYSTVDIVITVDAGAPPSTPPATVSVPNVIGMSESSARAELEHGPLATVVEWVDGDPAQAFLVQSQEPAAGEEVAVGAEVKIRLVKYAPAPPPTPTPPTKVVLPNLLGMTQSQAEDLLAGIGLVANPLMMVNPSAPALRVFGQQLSAGTLVDVGTQVTFRVAQPPPPPAPVPVPQFFGRTKGQALVLAAEAGIALTIQEFITTSWPPHRVYSQSVAPYSYVPLGTSVYLKLARPPVGPSMTTVPDLTGKTSGQATSLLAAAGLAGSATEVWTLAHPAFRVFDQAPAPGTSVPVGTIVAYKIARPPLGPILTPNLIGLSKLDAIAAVTAVGLVPNAQDLFAPGKPLGKVFDQSPNAGFPRLPGQTVTFKVAKMLTVSVPNLTGLTTVQANAALAAASLTGSGSVVVAPGNPIGKVYAQLPLAGANVVPGTLVQFKVAGFGPPAPVVVPNLIGKTKLQAIQALTLAGLGNNPDIVITLAHPEGLVFAQLPIAGANVANGTVVTFKVAKKPVLMKVPNLVGLTPGVAKNTLEALGLVSNGSMVIALLKPHNRVYSQNVLVGTFVVPGTVVSWKWNP